MSLLEAEITPGGVGGDRGDVWSGEPFVGPQRITDPFGIPRKNSVGYHLGGDFQPLASREVRFRRTVKVLWVGTWQPGQDRKTTNGGYGNVVTVEDDFGVRYTLAHNASFGPAIANWIQRGKPVGNMPVLAPNDLLCVQGNTGYVMAGGVPVTDPNEKEAGVHSHFEMRRNIGGAYVTVNPVAFVSGESPIDDLPERGPVPVVVPRDYLDEVRVLLLTVAQLRSDPSIPPQTVYDAIERELRELQVALGG